MLRFIPAPTELADWADGAVVVRPPADVRETRFPPTVNGMITMRLSGHITDEQGAALPAATFHGLSNRTRTFGNVGAVSAVGVILTPEAAPILAEAGWSARELAGTVLDAKAALGSAWETAEAEIARSTDDDARVRALFRFVAARAAHPSRQAACARLRGLTDRVTCTQKAKRHTATRSLERQFATEFGISPHRFAILHRLRATVIGLVNGTNGAQLALDQGYYDQSHLARDLRRFVGRQAASIQQLPATPLDPDWPIGVAATRHHLA